MFAINNTYPIMITKFSTCLLFLALLLNSCQQRNQPTSPQYEPEYNSSTTPALIDIEKALNHPAMLKLSQIASKLEYYNVGDARYTVTQAIAIPDNISAPPRRRSSEPWNR